MSLKPLYNDVELLQKIAHGDQRAFRTIYDRYSRKVYIFALRILNSESLAEEVMQETMLKLWQMGSDLETIHQLEPYLHTVSRNYCYNIFRRQKLEFKFDAELSKDWAETHNETEESILLNDTRKVLQDGIALLPQQQRLVYQLCHQEGLKYEEAAERLNLSAHTVQSYMKLALRSLRSYVSQHTDVAAILIIFKLL